MPQPEGAEQADDLAGLDREIDGVDRDQLIEALGGLLELDVGHPRAAYRRKSLTIFPSMARNKTINEVTSQRIWLSRRCVTWLWKPSQTLRDPSIELLKLLVHLDPQLLDLAGHDHLDVLLGRDRAVDLVGKVLGKRLRQLGLDAVLDQIAREACRVHESIRLSLLTGRGSPS